MGEESRNRLIKYINSNQQLLIVVVLFIFGIALRLLFISGREIAYDDAFSYFLARNSLSTIIDGTSSDTMPPLYYFLLHFWMRISNELWFLRSLNVLINIGSACFLYYLSKDLFSNRVATIALSLFLVSPFQIYHSQELRMYSLMQFGLLGFYYSIVKIIILNNENQKKWTILSIFFGLISMYSHNLGIISILPVNILFLFYRDKRSIKKIVFIQGLTYLLYLPWVYFLPQQIEKVQRAFWTQLPGIGEIIQSIMTLFSFLPMSLIEIGISLIFLIQILLFVFIYIFKAKSEKLWIISLFLIFPPVILFVLSYLLQPVYVPRIFIISAVWFFILFAKYFDKSNNLIGKLNYVVFLIISLVGLINFYTYNDFPRSEFKKLSNYLESPKYDDYVIVHDNKLSFFPTIFYKENSNQFYIQDNPGSPNDTLSLTSQEALGYLAHSTIEDFLDHDEIIFVVFQQTVDEYQAFGSKHPVLETLFENYNNNYSVDSIGDILLYNFEQKNEKN